MGPHQLVSLVGPANNFAMGSLPMHLARVLLMEGKPLPKELFLEVMVEKTQILIDFIKKPPHRPLPNREYWREHCCYQSI